MKILSFDVESNGLHGQAFAIAAVVIDGDKELARFIARCPIVGPVDPWVAENVLPVMEDMAETHPDYRAMLEDFYLFLQKHSEGAKIVVFVLWPVESRVLSDIFSHPESRRFEGPFPVTDLSTALDTLGYDPRSFQTYLDDQGLTVPIAGALHHPLYDAYATLIAYRHLITAVWG